MSDERKQALSPAPTTSWSPAPRMGGGGTPEVGRSPAGPESRPNGRSRLRQTIRQVLPKRAADGLGQSIARAQIKSGSVLGDPMQFRRPAHERECPLCDYRGRFWSHGTPPRGEAMCPRCLSLERHRLLHLLIDRFAATALEGKRVLHFAPEACVRGRLGRMSDYVTADIDGRGVDCQCAMEAIPFADGSIDAVIANHVLEHVDDDVDAMREVRRVLGPGGMAILSVPIIQGWDETYENPGIVAPHLRRTHFGQEDHKRLYGRDFTDRLRRAGFMVDVFRADPESEVRYGLRRGDRFFIARPAPSPETAE